MSPARKPLHALLLHGLNNAPAVMAPVAARLTQMGIGVSVGQLSGHWEQKDRLQYLRQASADIWLRDAERAYLEMVGRHTDKDFIFVGYSLGALLGVLLRQSGKAEFQKMLLLAPALYLRPWSYLPKLLRPLRLNIPSAMPMATRANPATPTSAYQALFDLVKMFDPQKFTDPALVIMNPRDELVNFRKVQAGIARNRRASLLAIRKTPGIKHLLTDEAWVGAQNWDRIWTAAKSFIESPTN